MKTESESIRAPAVAGAFYPASALQLGRLVDSLLDSARTQVERSTRDGSVKIGVSTAAPSAAVPKAIIVPHAGYSCSAPIAASAFHALRGARGITRVVLLGPSHFVGFRGLALAHAHAFATPLGCVPVDVSAYDPLEHLPQVRVFDRAHEPEHCLEVELPFLQRCLPSARIVPLLTGEGTDAEVAEVLDLLWDGTETLIVISSDLSHYLEYHAARALDEQTADSIEQLKPHEIQPEQACGSLGIRGLLLAARKHGITASTLDLRNSGDTIGSRQRVVGYGAFSFS